ncbi:serine/threonine-protein kinase [Aeoliella mucimassa]|uniref:Serine/threonine-protein kinase StkP n=1 Tax=Aeoliella mucimassa TaxID=2527972 RepID=A0A518AJC2_9BACT|nr:serine/threonine-protein kinase [Aeoliella mucimassa]QDU54833.1 Serine/threonine-protein kinase StkP [Aeoliella mucimassa]
MTTTSPTSADDDWTAVDTIIDRFEQARRDSQVVRLEDFLPAADDPIYPQAAAELIRVDLEYCWNEGAAKRLADYQEIAPRLFSDTLTLSQVAFEEFRLRLQAGEPITAAAYEEEYGVDTSDWPIIGHSASTVGLESSEPASDFDSDYPAAGDDFAGFRLVREIGRGAFARVFLAEQNDLARRPVVLKLSRRRSLEPEHLARLQHTNIVPIYSVHEADGLVAVCMPFLGERTLAHITSDSSNTATPDSIALALQSTIARHHEDTIVGVTPSIEPLASSDSRTESTATQASTVSTAPALQVVRDVAIGLSHAHVRGIVHRDLKPANILIADDGRPMLLDFNLSDDAAVNGLASLTIGGTLPYMAPEHLQAVRHGGDVDHQADIYSLGVILYELLAAARPFADRKGDFEQVVDGCIADRRSPLASLRNIQPAVTPSVDAIVSKCLAPRSEDRYQSADHLAEDLSRQLSDLPLLYASNPSLVERAAKWRRRHPKLMSATTAGVLGLLLAAVFAGLWIARANQLSQLEARQHFAEFRDSLPPVRMALSLPDSDRDLLIEGLQVAEQATDMVLDSAVESWQTSRDYKLLSSDVQHQLDEYLAEVFYLQARAERILSQDATRPEMANRWLERAMQHNRLAASIVGADSYAIASQKHTIAELMGQESSLPSDLSMVSEGPLDDYLTAQQLLAEHHYSEAAARLKQLRELHPTDPVVWLLLGNALVGLGELADVEAAFSTAMALEPRSYVAQFHRGLCRLQRGQPLQGLEDFDAILARQPKLVSALLNSALCYEAAGNLSASVADLTAAIDTNEAPPRALLLRSRVKQQMGDTVGAEADRLAGVALVPVDETGWIARGIAQLDTNPQAALADFRTALARNPKSVDAWKNVVHVTADRLNQPEDALAALNEWLAIEPENANAMIGRAVLYARLKQNEKARNDIEDALNLSREPVILFQAACAYSLMAGSDPTTIDQGVALLSRAFDLDLHLLYRAGTDADLATLRNTKSYQQLMSAYQALGEVKRDLNKPPPDQNTAADTEH